MRTKEEILKKCEKDQLWDTLEFSNSISFSILEALLDIRDILCTKANEGIVHVYPLDNPKEKQ